VASNKPGITIKQKSHVFIILKRNNMFVDYLHSERFLKRALIEDRDLIAFQPIPAAQHSGHNHARDIIADGVEHCGRSVNQSADHSDNRKGF
jgi:hypothetical protein